MDPDQPVANVVDAALAAREEEATTLEDELVLDLSELAPERPPFRLRWADKPEGEIFHLAVMGDFGIEEQQQLTRDGAEYDRLWNSPVLSAAEKVRLKQLLDLMFERVVHDVPPEVRNQIRDEHRSQIVLAFTLAPLAAAARREQAKKEAREEAERELPTSAN